MIHRSRSCSRAELRASAALRRSWPFCKISLAFGIASPEEADRLIGHEVIEHLSESGCELSERDAALGIHPQLPLEAQAGKLRDLVAERAPEFERHTEHFGCDLVHPEIEAIYGDAAFGRWSHVEDLPACG